MFYNEISWNWGDQAELPVAENATMLFEDIEYSDLSQGNDLFHLLIE